jgi:hypothetical protein
MNRQDAKEKQVKKTTATAEAQRRRGNAEKSNNRKDAEAQRKAARNFCFGFPLRPSASLRLSLLFLPFLAFLASWRFNNQS